MAGRAAETSGGEIRERRFSPLEEPGRPASTLAIFRNKSSLLCDSLLVLLPTSLLLTPRPRSLGISMTGATSASVGVATLTVSAVSGEDWVSRGVAGNKCLGSPCSFNGLDALGGRGWKEDSERSDARVMRNDLDRSSLQTLSCDKVR